MKKTILKVAIFSFFIPFFLFSFTKAKTIVMDGEFDDWESVPLLIDDSITGYPYTGTIYYFDNDSNAWVEGSDESACMYTADRALDLGELKLTNDDNYLYLQWKKGSDFLNYYWRRGDATEEYSFSNEAAPDVSSNPCAGEIVAAPSDFDHDLVLSIDKDKDGFYDYYLVIRISFDAGDYDGYDTAGFIYEDNGNGTYAAAEETLLTTFANQEYEVSPSAAAVNGAVLQEVKMDIAEIFSKLDLTWGDSINVRYESHSDLVDYTEAEEYTFEEPDNVEDENQKADILSWKAYRYTTNSACSNKLKVTIKGKHFEKNAEVKIGNKKAYSVNKISSKKIVAKFCMDKLLQIKNNLSRRIHVTNPDTDEETANKKIHLDEVGYKFNTSNFNSNSFDGIKNIQQALSQLGFLEEQYVTGFYGPITTNAIKSFQQQNGLPATGYFGPLTKAKLEGILK